MSLKWTLQPVADFSRIASDWDALCAAIGPLPFLESAFLIPLLDCFGTGRERIALAHRDGRLVAGGIIEPAGAGRWQTFQPSQLPLGPWLAASGESLDALTASLIRALPGFNAGVGLTQLDPLFQPRPESQETLRTLDYIETAWVDIDGPFDAYWEQRGKNLRTNTRKQRTKLESEGVTLHLDILRDAADVPAAIAEYGRLETSGWKAGTGTAVAPDNDQGRFYTVMLQRFCELGRAEIWRYRFNDQVMAMDLSIIAGDTIVILKTAYDAQQKTISPATLLHHEAFRYLFESGKFRRIEFYGRVMEWHTRWTEQRRTLYHATAYRWALLSRVHQHLQQRAQKAEAPAATQEAAPPVSQ